MVTDELASCGEIYVYLHRAPRIFDLVVDDVQIIPFQTNAPTISPTFGATIAEAEATDAPTISPTSNPTVEALTSCPVEELAPSEIPKGPIMLAQSATLCVLTKAISDGSGTLSSVTPVAISYDGGYWEKAGGEFAAALLYGQEFGNYDRGSHIYLPDLAENERYYLTSYSHAASETDKVARFLETATFGRTAHDISSWHTSRGDFTLDNAKQWIVDQMTLEKTSHREFFRRRVNQRVSEDIYDRFSFRSFFHDIDHF